MLEVAVSAGYSAVCVGVTGVEQFKFSVLFHHNTFVYCIVNQGKGNTLNRQYDIECVE